MAEMAKPKCSNCIHHLLCMRGGCKAHSVCEDWDGDCQICNLAGEPVLRDYCVDCDWEDIEEEQNG